jgi:serine/threonine protein kinase
MVARFRREGVASSKLVHHASVKVYNFGETDDGVLWLAMEFLDGKTLDLYLREKQKLSTKELLAILRPICELLEEAHGKGIVHRDLKPENIMIMREPSLTAKVLDFGLASLMESDDKATQTGMVSGTPRYMSPEQWKGLKYTDHRADLYALGVIVYQCLSGRLPFDADTGPAWMQKHCMDEPIDLEVASSYSVTPAVKSAVAKALLKEPDHRYQSAMEFYRAIEAAVEKNAAVTMVQKAGGPAPKPIASSAISGNVTLPTMQVSAPAKGLSLKFSLGKFQIAFSLAFALVAGIVVLPLIQQPAFAPQMAEPMLISADDASEIKLAQVPPASLATIDLADDPDAVITQPIDDVSDRPTPNPNGKKTKNPKVEPPLQKPPQLEPKLADPTSDNPKTDPTPTGGELADPKPEKKPEPTPEPKPMPTTTEPQKPATTLGIPATEGDLKPRIKNIATKCFQNNTPKGSAIGYKGKLTISPSGAIKSLTFEVTSDAFLKGAIQKCAEREIKAFKIQPTADGNPLSFSF